MVLDSTVTQNGVVFALMSVPLGLTFIVAIGKYLFDDGLFYFKRLWYAVKRGEDVNKKR
jgi:hypothetical protein